ncbi:HEPN domain-containing protein [Acidianus infernus]|uniref:HEPN domain-containing protein n=1 Tax=Acidianus infernus TaxID=12915 RepID=UPI0030B7FEA0
MAYQEGYYNVSCFYAEQVVQLKAKAFIFRFYAKDSRNKGIAFNNLQKRKHQELHR